MNILDKLDQSKLQEIVVDMYKRGQSAAEMNVGDAVEDIKKQMLSILKMT